MKIGEFLAMNFERIPEWPIKNSLRYFLAFNRFVPSFISDLSPVKGYEKYYQLKRGDVVVDAGAYPGDYAIFAGKRVGDNGKVICFEPDPKNRKVLEKNILAEKLKNIIVIPKGLWNENAVLKFSKEDFKSSLEKEGEIEIEVVRLDDELKKLNIGRVNVLKMDIEGAEIQAMEGCEKILKENKVNVAIASYHVVNGKKTSYFLENFLSKLGYTVKTNFPKHLTTYAWKNIRGEND